MAFGLVENEVFIAVLSATVISQISKIIINLVSRKKEKNKNYFSTGGMPSTHSALVSSLFAILLLTQGLSPITVVSLALCIVVITDALGVRRTAGEEGLAINKIIKKEKLHMKQLRYSLGHKPLEVIVGISLGIFVSLAVWFLI